jgi:thioredoxin reductase (NADPH)
MDQLNAEKILEQRAAENPKISLLLGHEVVSVNGSGCVESVTVRSRSTGEQKDLAAQGVFVWIGFKPNTEFLRGTVDLDPTGSIPTNADMSTSVPGLFAAGDVRSKAVRQVTTAVGDATIAADSALKFIESH